MAEIKIQEVVERIDLGAVNPAAPAEAKVACPNCQLGVDDDGDGNCAVCTSPAYQQAQAPPAKDVCHTRAECEQVYAALDPEKRAAAIEFLRAKFAEAPAEDRERIKQLLAEHGPEEWIHHLYDLEISKLTEEQKERGMAAMYISQGHFGFGMAMRNVLRDGEFGEKELGVHNLDDVYLQLVTEAIGKL